MFGEEVIKELRTIVRLYVETVRGDTTCSQVVEDLAAMTDLAVSDLEERGITDVNWLTLFRKLLDLFDEEMKEKIKRKVTL
jgi:hypothetical protein